MKVGNNQRERNDQNHGVVIICFLYGRSISFSSVTLSNQPQ